MTEASKARASLECWLLQAMFLDRDRYWHRLSCALPMGAFREPLNFLVYRFMLLEDGDFIETGIRILRDSTWRTYQLFRQRFCGGFDLYGVAGDPPVDEIINAMKADADEAFLRIKRHLNLPLQWDLFGQETALGSSREVRSIRP